MTRMQEVIAIIAGVLTITGVVGGFGIGLMRRWWGLEQYIKNSMELDKKFRKSDRKLKNELKKLVEQKLSDHQGFQQSLDDMRRDLDALQNRTARGELRSPQRGNR